MSKNVKKLEETTGKIGLWKLLAGTTSRGSYVPGLCGYPTRTRKTPGSNRPDRRVPEPDFGSRFGSGSGTRISGKFSGWNYQFRVCARMMFISFFCGADCNSSFLFLAFSQEVQFYLSESSDMALPPFSFWKSNSARFPILALLSRKFQSAPSTSYESERMFSAGRMILSDYRKSMSHESLEQLLFFGLPEPDPKNFWRCPTRPEPDPVRKSPTRTALLCTKFQGNFFFSMSGVCSSLTEIWSQTFSKIKLRTF